MISILYMAVQIFKLYFLFCISYFWWFYVETINYEKNYVISLTGSFFIPLMKINVIYKESINFVNGPENRIHSSKKIFVLFEYGTKCDMDFTNSCFLYLPSQNSLQRVGKYRRSCSIQFFRSTWKTVLTWENTVLFVSAGCWMFLSF